MPPWEEMSQAQDSARSLLVGERVRLRDLHDDDLPLLEQWWHEAATGVLQQNNLRPRPSPAAREMFRQWSANDSGASVGFSIVTLAAGDLIGHLTLWGVDACNRGATLAIIVGDEHTGQGYGGDAVRVLVRYGLQEMGLHRIELQTWAFNARALSTCRRAGFVVEGQRRDAVFHDGAFHDEVVMSILEHEWRAR